VPSAAWRSGAACCAPERAPPPQAAGSGAPSAQRQARGAPILPINASINSWACGCTSARCAPRARCCLGLAPAVQASGELLCLPPGSGGWRAAHSAVLPAWRTSRGRCSLASSGGRRPRRLHALLLISARRMHACGTSVLFSDVRALPTLASTSVAAKRAWRCPAVLRTVLGLCWELAPCQRCSEGVLWLVW